MIDLHISLRFLFNSPSWQKSPVNSVRVQSQIGPSSVAMQTPSFLQGLPLAQALTVLDRTPCKKKTEHISISPRFSSRHPWWLGKLSNGVALFELHVKKTYRKVISVQKIGVDFFYMLFRFTFRTKNFLDFWLREFCAIHTTPSAKFGIHEQKFDNLRVGFIR